MFKRQTFRACNGKLRERSTPAQAMRYWLLVLKPGECMTFDLPAIGLTFDTAQDTIHNANRMHAYSGRRYESRRIDRDKSQIGVRLLCAPSTQE